MFSLSKFRGYAVFFTNYIEFEGGIPDMISDGYNGFLVDPFETEKLANSILSLINNKQLRISMSKNSFKRFNDHYTLKIFEKKLLKTFNDILNE